MVDMNDILKELDIILAQGITSVSEIKTILGISKNELFTAIQNSKGGYSTAGILSDHGTITKNEYDEK
jgi:hypothetical protein